MANRSRSSSCSSVSSRVSARDSALMSIQIDSVEDVVCNGTVDMILNYASKQQSSMVGFRSEDWL